MATSDTIRNHAAFIWSFADLLRGDYKQSEYGKVILPLTVLRRLDCVLEPTKQKVLDRAAQLEGRVQNLDPILQKEAGEQFFNTSRYDFSKFSELLDAPEDLADNLRHYIASFSATARDIIDKFDFGTQIARLDRSNLLYLVVSKFAEIDLHPDAVSNLEMGYLYEELIRRFSELSNETAGEHFTPREVIRLMVNLLFIEDEDLLTRPGIVKTILDPACGTGGMLSVAEERLRELNPAARLVAYGQEPRPQPYAICRSDMMLRGQDATNIAFGNSFSEDGHPGLKVDYCLANPPFGVEWKKVADVVKDEADKLGFAGRFGAGLPRINDGSFLFLQHMISKMKPVSEGGSRVAIVFNGSPLFTGAAGSGESEIRRWIIENDWLEAVVALPDQLFYNTGISTYFWVVTNRKHPERRGKVQLIDARDMFVKMRKSLGEKRKQISDAQIDEIVCLYGDFTENDKVKILPLAGFTFPSPMLTADESVSADRPEEHQQQLCAFQPWMFAGSVGPVSHVRLGDIAQLRPERRPALDGEPLLLGRDLASSTTIMGGSGTAEEGRLYNAYRAGDIVGSGRVWAVIPENVAARITSLDVVRLKEGYESSANVACEWLASADAAQQAVGVGIGRNLRPDLMVPRYLLEDRSLHEAAATLRSVREQARRLLDGLFDDPFRDSADAPTAATRLIGLTSRAKAIGRLLEPLSDIVQRAEWSYPHQIAELARHYRLESSPQGQLQAALRLIEAIVREIGTLAGATLLAAAPSGYDVLDHFKAGGIASGSWLHIVQEAQRMKTLKELPELAEMSFGKRGIGTLLSKGINVRNRLTHAHGVASNEEAKDWHSQLETLLVEALDGTVWLSTLDHLFVRSCHYWGEPLSLEISGSLLNGAHPVWERRSVPVAEPIAPARVVALLPSSARPLPLHPFVTVMSCADCRREEAFVLDRIDSNRATGRSIRDHLHAVTL